jgi:hypothetical protein
MLVGLQFNLMVVEVAVTRLEASMWDPFKRRSTVQNQISRRRASRRTRGFNKADCSKPNSPVCTNSISKAHHHSKLVGVPTTPTD